MRAERALAGAAVFVIVISAVVAVAVPSALTGPEEEPGHARLTDITVAAGEVSPDTATLNVTAFLQHFGGVSENLSVRVRTTHLESGLHATTEEVDLEPVEGDTEVAVPLTVTVPREGGYRVEVQVYKDGQRRGDIAREVQGVGSLQPASARSSVRFHRFDQQVGNETLPSVQSSVDSVDEGDVTLNVSAYLTNEGGTETSDLSVQFVVRQAESGLVAARTRVPLDAVPAQNTVTPATTVTVPDGYNYYIDAILWKDGVIVDSARGVANLDPDESIRVNHSEASGGLQVSDFERDDEFTGGQTPTENAVETSSPGLGASVALLALLAVAFLARRQA